MQFILVYKKNIKFKNILNVFKINNICLNMCY